MTKAQKKKLIKDLVDKWKGKLFLGDWHFHICLEDKDNEQGNCATINPCFTYMNATLCIFPSFWQYEEYAEEYIVHELVHCHIEGLASITKDLHDGRYHAPHSITHAVEKLTQRFTRCVLNGR